MIFPSQEESAAELEDDKCCKTKRRAYGLVGRQLR